jgi:hypothetical protein
MGERMNWRKSSYSGNCVEVGGHGSRVLVRDTKDTAGPMLRFSPAAWRSFADQVKADQSLSLDRRSGLASAVRGTLG